MKMFGLGKKKSKPRGRKARRSRAKKRSGGKRKPFGGYSVSFAGRKETMEQVFGRGSIPPSQMTKKLWKFVKAKRLASR